MVQVGCTVSFASVKELALTKLELQTHLAYCFPYL